jgi:hypothetical protein
VAVTASASVLVAGACGTGTPSAAGGSTPTAGPTPTAAPTLPSTAYPQGVAGQPEARNHAALAFDPASRRLILFGGFAGQEDVLSDTWAWNGTGWRRLSPASSPPATFYASAASWPDGHTIVMVGGQRTAAAGANGPPPGATWLWDGASWRLAQTTQSPPTSLAAGMAYDPAQHQEVLFVAGQTWTWNGQDWTQQRPATSPPARELGAMASTPTGVLLFGGNAPGNTSRTFGDTWMWSGGNWKRLSPANTPKPRYALKMVVDASSGHAILFGGTDDRSAFDDTWRWDGTNWTQLAAHGPGPGADPVMAFDPVQGVVILFGTFGPDLPHETTGTWAWNGSTWTPR